MNLEQAIQVLNREKHANNNNWQLFANDASSDWIVGGINLEHDIWEFDAIFLAQAYENKRELEQKVKAAEAALEDCETRRANVEAAATVLDAATRVDVNASLEVRIKRVLDDLDIFRKEFRGAIRLAKDAFNVAAGLTNYVEDRPELRTAERELEIIQSAIRAAQALLERE